jgi:putative toxin-antitoxin system antitoxin component (TIGR02293 family)
LDFLKYSKNVVPLEQIGCAMKKQKNYIEMLSHSEAPQASEKSKGWNIKAGRKTYAWLNAEERISVVREGLPYETVDVIGQRMGSPIKSVLNLLGIPQTTYNKKKSEHALMDRRESEWILSITELITYGIDVFNMEEEKFMRWLKKPNPSLGGLLPETLLDTFTGIEQVKTCLDQLEYGSFA